MKRLLATTLLVGYVMLVPFCFFGALGALHQADHARHATHTLPLSEHIAMYGTVSSAHLGGSDLVIVPMLLLSIIVPLFACALLSLAASIARVERSFLRRERALLNYRRTLLRFLARLIASPNRAYTLA